jgi:hypothetical protein
MVDKKASKKDDDVKKIEKVEKKAAKVSYTDKVINRRGRDVTIRTYADGKVEEL